MGDNRAIIQPDEPDAFVFPDSVSDDPVEKFMCAQRRMRLFDREEGKRLDAAKDGPARIAIIEGGKGKKIAIAKPIIYWRPSQIGRAHV